MSNPDHFLDSKKKSIPKCQILITFLKSWFLSWSSKEINTQMQNLDQFLQNLITFQILKRNQYPNVKSRSLYGNLDYFLHLQKKSIPKCKILITFLILKRNQYPNSKSWSLSWILKYFLDPKKESILKCPNLITFLESELLNWS